MSTVCSSRNPLIAHLDTQLATHGFRSAIWPFHGAWELANGLGKPDVVPRIYASIIQRHRFSVTSGSSLTERLCRGRHALRNPAQLAPADDDSKTRRGASNAGLGWPAKGRLRRLCVIHDQSLTSTSPQGREG